MNFEIRSQSSMLCSHLKNRKIMILKKGINYFCSKLETKVHCLLNRFYLNILYFYKNDSYLKKNGWFNSFRKGLPVNHKNEPIPWFAYPAIKFIESKLNREMIVFEYGCGNSTLWWSKHVKYVFSCEHNVIWYESMKRLIPVNVVLYQVDLDHGYSKKVLEFKNKFDIVVIDGRDRVNCAINTIEALKINGIIIWDNSDREKYKEGYDYLISKNFKRIDFEGIGSLSSKSWCTSIFYRKNNCIGI